MLEYLPMIISGLQLFGQASAMNNVAKGYQQTPAEMAQLQALSNRDRLLRSIINPDDIVYKNIAAEENKQLNNSTQQALSNLLSANRRAQSMGRQTFFNPERQDEAISQFLSKHADKNYNTARSNALNRIISAANGYSGSANNYGGMIPNQQNAQNINNAKTPTMFGMGSDMLKQFGNGGSMSNIFQMLSNFGGGGGSAPSMALGSGW